MRWVTGHFQTDKVVIDDEIRTEDSKEYKEEVKAWKERAEVEDLRIRAMKQLAAAKLWKKEEEILQVLEWQLTVPTITSFVDIYLLQLEESKAFRGMDFKEIKKECDDLSIFCLRNGIIPILFLPSLMAMSIVWKSVRKYFSWDIFTSALEKGTLRYQKISIDRCLAQIEQRVSKTKPKKSRIPLLSLSLPYSQLDESNSTVPRKNRCGIKEYSWLLPLNIWEYRSYMYPPAPSKRKRSISSKMRSSSTTLRNYLVRPVTSE